MNQKHLTLLILIIILFQNVVIAQLRISDKQNWALVKAGTYTSGEQNEVLKIDYDYEIMKTEVTNKQFLDFLNKSYSDGNIKVYNEGIFGYFEGDKTHPEDSLILFASLTKPDTNTTLIQFDGSKFSIDTLLYNFPVVYVTWFGANAFVKYYDLRLPTKEEWEKAARGMTGWLYPWGNTKDFKRVNLFDSGDPYVQYLTPVGFYDGMFKNGYQTHSDTSVYGVHDLIGNVDEWTVSLDTTTGYRMLAGGSCGYNWFPTAYYFQGTNPHEWGGYATGFRCIRERTISVVEKNESINKFQLNQNYPNPFNPATIINFTIPKTSFVTIKVYDVLGREVATLINEEKTFGNYKVEFNASNLASGIYFYSMQAGDFVKTKKLILLK